MAYKFKRYGEPRPCMTINPEPPTSVMTVPIVGVPRGGTTMVAAVVHALGVDLGPASELAKHTFEDQTMNRAAVVEQLAYLAKRNRKCNVWGWKNPLAVQTLRSIFFALKQPRVIIICRDIAATVESEMRFDAINGTNPRRTFSDLMQVTLHWWTENMEFIAQATSPMLLVSYERAIHMPEVFVHEVGAFLGITPTCEMLQDALARINPRGGYLRIDEQGHPVKIIEPVPEGDPSDESG